MDPLSITTACISLVATIGKLSIQVHSFVKQVRDARRDLDSVSRELASLKLTLESIAEDSKDPAVGFPDYLEQTILSIVKNCGTVVGQIQDVLEKYAGGGLRKGIKWTIGGKEDMDKLRMSLETHKSALELALEMVTMTIARDIKKDTSYLRDDTAVIIDNTEALKVDTAQILSEIERLRLQLPDTTRIPQNPSRMLEQSLDSLTTYAESEYAPSELQTKDKTDTNEKKPSIPERVESKKFEDADSAVVKAQHNPTKTAIKLKSNQNFAPLWSLIGGSIPPIGREEFRHVRGPRVFNIALLGFAQAGKSRLILTLQNSARTKGLEYPKIGDLTAPCTDTVANYPMGLLASTYKLINSSNKTDIDIPDDESSLLQKFSGKKSKDGTVVPSDPFAPIIDINLIDTVGYDDSRGTTLKVYTSDLKESLELLLSKLNSKKSHQGSIDAYFVVMRATDAFSSLHQEYLAALRQDVFGHTPFAIVNTDWNLRIWQYHHNDGQIETNRESKMSSGFQVPIKWKRMQQRLEACKAVFGDEIQQFFIDSLPHKNNPFEQLLSMNCITEMLKFITQCDKGNV